MKQLDFEVLERDAEDFTILLIDLWVRGVSFDGVFSEDDLRQFLYEKLQPHVLDVLSSDTQVDYEQVRDIVGTGGRPEIGIGVRNRWGETQFLSAICESLDHIQKQLQCAQPAAEIVPLLPPTPFLDDPEPMRLSQYVVRNWLDGSGSKEDREALKTQILPSVLSLTSAYWNTQRELPKDDVIYWFDEYMMPSTSSFVRKDWSVAQILKDIQMTFVTLEAKVMVEDQKLQRTMRWNLSEAVQQRRAKHTDPISVTPPTV